MSTQSNCLPAVTAKASPTATPEEKVAVEEVRFRQQCRADWAADLELQREFRGSYRTFEAYRIATRGKPGKAGLASQPSAVIGQRVSVPPTESKLVAMADEGWKDPKVRAEFKSKSTYLAYLRATERRG